MEVLGAPGDMHGPGRVAEVPAQLTGDGGPGERTERHPAIGVEALDRLQHPEPRHLDEVVERLAATVEPQRFAPGELEVLLDEPVADRVVAGAAIRAKALQ